MLTEYDLSRTEVRTALPGSYAPYWNSLGHGRALGFVKPVKRPELARWVARIWCHGHGYETARIGKLRDLDAEAAESAAQIWFSEMVEAGFARPFEYVRHWRIRPAFVLGVYTVEHALADFVNQFPSTSRRARDEYYRATRIICQIGNTPCDALTLRELERWRYRELAIIAKNAWSRNAVSTAPRAQVHRNRRTMNRQISTLKAALEYAHTRRLASEPNVLRSFARCKEPQSGAAVSIPEAHLTRLRDAAPDDLNVLINAILGTGCRIGEAMRLNVCDICPTSGKLLVRTTKSGRNRSVVLGGATASQFARLCDGRPPDAPLLTRGGVRWSYGNANYDMRRARAAAGLLAGVTFHALRHTYATRLAEAGAPISLIARQLGHKSAYFTEVTYVHATKTYEEAILRQSLDVSM